MLHITERSAAMEQLHRFRTRQCSGRSYVFTNAPVASLRRVSQSCDGHTRQQANITKKEHERAVRGRPRTYQDILRSFTYIKPAPRPPSSDNKAVEVASLRRVSQSCDSHTREQANITKNEQWFVVVPGDTRIFYVHSPI